MRNQINKYDWSNIEIPADLHIDQIDAFTTVVVPSTYSDICKQEQIMADTLQQTRLVALVTERATPDVVLPYVLRYHVCHPDPNSAHRMR